MRVETLLSPGKLSNGINLRNAAARAISSVEISAGRTPGGKTIAAKELYDFFADAATKLSTLYDVTVPTFTGVVNSATEIELTFSEAMDTGVVPAAAAFGIPGDTVDSVAWGAGPQLGKLVLTGTGFAAAESLTYTKPATNWLRDLAGNAAATATVVLA